MPYYVEGRQAGKTGLKQESHRPELLLSNFLPPDHPLPHWDGTGGITNWGMDGNDVWGDCGAAATDHYDMAKLAKVSLLNTLGNPKYQGTLPTYWAYGLAQGELGTAPNPPDEPDQGVDNATWFGWLFEQKIIEGYAEVPLPYLNYYAPMFGGAVVGQALPNSAIQDFEASPPVPWGQANENPNPDEGHDTLYIAFHDDGSGEMVTWGGLQPITNNYINRFATDAWVTFTWEDAQRQGVNVQQLQETLKALHGVP